MLKSRVLDLFARSTEAFAFGTLSESDRALGLVGSIRHWHLPLDLEDHRIDSMERVGWHGRTQDVLQGNLR